MTLGSLVISLVAFIPLFFIFNLLIKRYRKHVLSWVLKSKLMQILQSNKLYAAYSKFSDYKNALS